MTRAIAAVAALLASVIVVSPAVAQEAPSTDERSAVLAAVDGLFAAMLARDGAAVAAQVEPQGIVTAMSVGADGRSRVAHVSWADFAARLPQAPGPIRERIFDPEVRIRGDLAMVWSRYDLSVGDTFSHCGTDLFELVRRDGRWRMLHVTYTRETTGCEAR